MSVFFFIQSLEQAKILMSLK